MSSVCLSRLETHSWFSFHSSEWEKNWQDFNGFLHYSAFRCMKLVLITMILPRIIASARLSHHFCYICETTQTSLFTVTQKNESLVGFLSNKLHKWCASPSRHCYSLPMSSDSKDCPRYKSQLGIYHYVTKASLVYHLLNVKTTIYSSNFTYLFRTWW